jgi:hypothetical protein
MKAYILGAVLSVLLILSAAGVQAAGNGWARVRAIHASPDAPSVDIWANGAPLFEDAPFKGVTDYAKVKPDTYNIQVVPAGATEPVVIDADLPLKARMDYTVIAIGKLADIEPLVLTDNRGDKPKRTAAIRFVHASPDAPAVDIRVKGGPVLFKGVEFGEETDYKRVRQGYYDIEVVVAGTDTVALEVENVYLKKRTMSTAIAVGQLSDNSLGALLVKDR